MNGKQGMGGWLMVYNFFSFFLFFPLLVGGQHDGMDERCMLRVVLEGNKRSGLYDNDIPDAVSMIVATGLGCWVPVYVCMYVCMYTYFSSVNGRQ